MNRILIFGGVVALIGGIILFLYKDNQRTKIELAKEKEITKTQKIVIKYKDGIIETKNYQQKLIRKTSVNSDVAYRRKFLRVLFSEREANSNR